MCAPRARPIFLSRSVTWTLRITDPFAWTLLALLARSARGLRERETERERESYYCSIVWRDSTVALSGERDTRTERQRER